MKYSHVQLEPLDEFIVAGGIPSGRAYGERIIAVTGGRDFNQDEFSDYCLNYLRELLGFNRLVHGNQRGLDRKAGRWARSAAVLPIPFPYRKEFGNAGGPMRNTEMLDYGVDYVAGFAGGSGTANMMTQALGRKVPVIFCNHVYKTIKLMPWREEL